MSGQTLFNKALPMTQVHGVIFAASSLWKLLASFFEDYSKVLFFGKGFPDSSVGKESTCNTGDPSSIPGLGRCAGEGIGYPLQYSGLENSMDCRARGVAKSQTQRTTLILTFHS